tara:strand:- start:1 stop:576 length:576 start_codon:yes stop_codon:yes gene_type:complete
MKIFFYGGTFDPPHIGHKKIIEALLPRCDKIIIFPAKKSPFKKVYPIASNIHRINMLNLLFENNKVIIDDYEILSEKSNYTYLTIDYLEKKYLNCSFTMIIGRDQMANLSQWNNFSIFIKKINIICFNRPLKNKLEALNYNSNKIENICDFNIDTSSTNIRDNIKLNNNKYLSNNVSSKILEYIERNNLYA